MPSYTLVNLKTDVEDMAPKFGFAPNLESRFARRPLGLENSGLSYYRVAPSYRLPFGHHHSLAFGAPSNENEDAEMVEEWWVE
jgi:hypothetical protein